MSVNGWDEEATEVRGAAPEGTRSDGRLRAQWIPESALVVAHERCGRDRFKLTLQAPEIARRAAPGHFVEVKVPAGRATGYDPLLRRPLSICQIRPGEGTIRLIYGVVGRGTELLATAAVGQEVDLLGPLGMSFPDPGRGTGPVVLVGGGLGIPPLVAAAEWARWGADRPVTALIGARTAEYLAGREELERAAGEVLVATEDGSAGFRGLVTDLLAEAIRSRLPTEVWACGPNPMLRAVKEICAREAKACWVSVEQYMACGFGTCVGCTVPRADGSGYYQTCSDGPVFRAEEVALGG